MSKENNNLIEQDFERRQKKFSEEDLENIIKHKSALENKFQKQSKLQRFFADFKLLFSLLSDFFGGRYKQVPWLVISSVGAAFLYVLSPIDFIPDFIPFIGFIDDASVMAFCIKLIRKDVAKYREWKQNQESIQKININH